ncbi:MAG: tetratricopeptide repeat protein [Pontiella sp.]
MKNTVYIMLIGSLLLCFQSFADEESLAKEGTKYMQGKGVKRDYQQAVALYEAAYLTEENAGFIALFLGRLYFSGGYGLEKDLSKAIEWFDKSIEKGFRQSYTQIIDLYIDPASGDLYDIDKALEYGEEMQDKGYDGSSDSVLLAKMYAQAEDFERAVEFQNEGISSYKRLRNPTESTIEQYEKDLVKYENNERPYAEASKYVPKPSGLFWEGQCYLIGTKDVPRDIKNAVFKLVSAYNKGEHKAESALLLADIFAGRVAEGNVPKSHNKALSWYRRAIDKGEVEGLVGIIRLCLRSEKPSQQRVNEALKCASQLYKEKTNNPEHLRWIAQACAAGGRYEDAVRFQQECVELLKQADGDSIKRTDAQAAVEKYKDRSEERGVLLPGN